MDYFELLEQDTENAEVQFELYKACIEGQGEGNDEANDWLNLAAQNGYAEAIEILKSKENEKKEPEKDYSCMSLLELYEIAGYDYYAAKEQYRRFNDTNTDQSFIEKVRMLSKITKFEISTVEDFETLAYEIIKGGSVRLFDNEKAFISACKNAKELGSKIVAKYLLNYKYCGLYTSTYPFGSANVDETTGNLHFEYAKYSDVIEKTIFYILLNTVYYSKAPDVILLRQAWYDEIKNDSQIGEHPRIEKIVDLIYSDFNINILEQVKELLQENGNYFSDSQVIAFVVVLLTDNLDEKVEYIKNYNLNSDCEFICSLCCEKFIIQYDNMKEEQIAEIKRQEVFKQQLIEQEQREKEKRRAEQERLAREKEIAEQQEVEKLLHSLTIEDINENNSEKYNHIIPILGIERLSANEKKFFDVFIQAKNNGSKNVIKYLLNYEYFNKNIFKKNSEKLEYINEMHREFVRNSDVNEKILYYVLLNLPFYSNLPNIFLLRNEILDEIEYNLKNVEYVSLKKLVDYITTDFSKNIIEQVKLLIQESNENSREIGIFAFVVVLLSKDIEEKIEYITKYNLNSDCEFICSLCCEQFVLQYDETRRGEYLAKQGCIEREQREKEKIHAEQKRPAQEKVKAPIIKTEQAFTGRRPDVSGKYLYSKQQYPAANNKPANGSKVDKEISKFFTQFKANKTVKIITIGVAVILLVVTACSFVSQKSDSTNMQKYLIKDNIAYNNGAYEGSATIASNPYDLIDWALLAQSSNIDVDELKKHFNCKFEDNNDSLKNGDIVTYVVTWDSKDVKNTLGVNLKGNGTYDYEIKVSNLGSTPLINLFDYITTSYDGYDGMCRIKLTGEKTAQQFEDYAIQLSKTNSDEYSGYSATSVISFNVYKNDMPVDNLVVYLDSSSLQQVSSKNSGTWYQLSTGAIVCYKVVSTYENSNLNFIGSKTETVPKLNTLLTTQNKDKLSTESYKKLKKASTDKINVEYGNGDDFSSSYILVNGTSSDTGYVSAIVFVYLSDYNYTELAIVYDPVIDEKGNLVNYCLENVFTTITYGTKDDIDSVKYQLSYSDIVELE